MINESKIQEVILEKPEHATVAELDILIMRQQFKNLSESPNLFKSLKLVDIEILIIKSDSFGKSKITTSR